MSERQTPIVKLRQAGDIGLRSAARPVPIQAISSAPIRRLIAMMRETLRDAGGVGLAAPQLGYDLQVAVIEDTAERQASLSATALAERGRAPVPFYVIINPVLSVLDPYPAWFFEGCLSVAGHTALVPRALHVRVTGFDEKSNPVTIEAGGWHARILQHEIDHLRGVLYLDRMETRSFMTQANYERSWKHLSVRETQRLLGCGLASDTIPTGSGRA